MVAIADAIVVLGARVLPDGLLGRAVGRRVSRAALAYHQGLAPVVVCAGGRAWNGHIESVRMHAALRELKVPDQAILLEASSLSTAENAYYCSRLLRMHGFHRVLVVSCPWHLRRAVRNFQRCGLTVQPLPAAAPSFSRSQALWRWSVERVSDRLDQLRLSTRVWL